MTSLHCVARAALGVSLIANTLGCADLLGIPSEPRLVDVPEAPATAPDILTTTPVAASEAPTASEGVPSGVAASPDELRAVNELGPTQNATAPQSARDSGSDAGTLPSDAGALDCARGGTAAMDIVMILDNSGSMQTETATVERSLNAWTALLDAGGLDYRLILLSRHRTMDRAASSPASSSICVERPLSGLASCPSPAPVLSQRFFHYSIKIEATDSLVRALESYTAPDSFNLAPTGWSAWLRPGARKVFIEISDADSELPAAEFARRLTALAPQHFGSDPAAPGFAFHSIVGLAEKPNADDLYAADEPIQTGRCTDTDGTPDNAGEAYQTLSRLTGGTRLPVCPSDALSVRLVRIVPDLLLRARRTCPPQDSTGSPSN